MRPTPVKFPFTKNLLDHRSEFSDPYNFRGIDKNPKSQETVATHIYIGLHIWVLRRISSADADSTVRRVSAKVAGGVPVAPKNVVRASIQDNFPES